MSQTAGQAAEVDRAAGPRLDLYLVDSGWNEKAKEILDTHLELFESFLTGHRIFVLNREQSREVLKQNIALIGKDPVLVLVDSDARTERRRYGYGVRLCLGAMPLRRVRENLGKVLQIACDRSRTSEQIINRIRAESRREGFDGAMQIIGELVRPEG